MCRAGGNVEYFYSDNTEKERFEVTDKDVTRSPTGRRLLETEIQSGDSVTTGDSTVSRAESVQSVLWGAMLNGVVGRGRAGE